jgi:hypothetical protein
LKINKKIKAKGSRPFLQRLLFYASAIPLPASNIAPEMVKTAAVAWEWGKRFKEGKMVEMRGLEPLTSALRTPRSPS